VTSLIWPERLPATAPVFVRRDRNHGQNEIDSKKELSSNLSINKNPRWGIDHLAD
jgi:hypothetical protein